MSEELQGDVSLEAVRRIMPDFAKQTGISSDQTSRRYLWTDAFAVCNFLELHLRTPGDTEQLDLALRLIDHVHDTLGRHRPDDSRSGWISGLAEEEGKQHPTKGGLRIGKKLTERAAGDPYDPELEWDRDGQYYHYLTKWMHALHRTWRVSGDTRYHEWAVELAKAAHDGFVQTDASTNTKTLAWKMSIDLQRPLVNAMGQHDPLDGLITFEQLQAASRHSFTNTRGLNLDSEIAELYELCDTPHWETSDPLGAGGLLTDTYRTAQLIRHGNDSLSGLFSKLLSAASTSLQSAANSGNWSQPPAYRLAFRELGLAIGLSAVTPLVELLTTNDPLLPELAEWHAQASRLRRFVPLGHAISQFWLQPSRQRVESWIAHGDINAVMLATSLAPSTYLTIR